MKGKVLLVTGVAIGYVLGSRSGRRSYEQLKGQARELWTSPTVQEQVELAKQYAREQAPVVQEHVVAAGRTVVDRAGSKTD